MINISTDKPIEVQVSTLSGTSSCVCYLPSGTHLSFLDGTFIKVSPCPDFFVENFNYKKK